MTHFRQPATFIATAALFMALGGGAVAATQTLISGSKIKPHSIAESKLTTSAVSALQSTAQEKNAPGIILTNTYAATNSIELGKGSYIVFGKVGVGDVQESAAIDCELDGPTSNDVDDAGVATQPSGGLVWLNVESALTLTKDGTVTLDCKSPSPHAATTGSDLIALKVAAAKAS